MNVFTFIRELRNRNISFRLLQKSMLGAICFEINVPGERWEVEFFEDGEIECEVFRSSGDITPGTEGIADLFNRFTD